MVRGQESLNFISAASQPNNRFHPRRRRDGGQDARTGGRARQAKKLAAAPPVIYINIQSRSDSPRKGLYQIADDLNAGSKANREFKNSVFTLLFDNEEAIRVEAIAKGLKLSEQEVKDILGQS